jgi:alginate O-acetyltransferase complex protein AlgI
MLFNSFVFILCFLPATLGLCQWFSRFGGRSACGFLLVASIYFYAAGHASSLPMLAASLAWNFWVGRTLCRLENSAARKAWLVAGVTLNLGALALCKAQIAGWFGSGIASFSTGESVLIPLAISFITFQQVAFLVDCHRRVVREVDPLHYLLFITFFPQLIMGPIVHYRELAPQFARTHFGRLQSSDLAAGLVLFTLGLAKKVLLADLAAPVADPVFLSAAQGNGPTFLDAWAGALAFQLQLYFDFSGYADMAVGLGRMMGVTLPVNFDSPYKSVDRMDAWRRWHITFSAFMRHYFFLPVVRAQVVPGGTTGVLMLTGFLAGLWHGFGPMFIVWGIAQGLLMALSHAWKLGMRRLDWVDRGGTPRHILRVTITFAVTVAMGTLFRSPDLTTVCQMWLGMTGGHGFSLPEAGRMLVITDWQRTLPIIIGLLGIVWFLPNSNQFTAQLGAPSSAGAAERPRWRLQLSPAWAVGLASLFFLALLRLTATQRFIYYQF